MDAENLLSILFLPGIIDQLLLISDAITILTFGSLSKSWHEVIFQRSTWISVARHKSLYLSKDLPTVSSAKIWILSQKPDPKSKSPFSLFEHKIASNNPHNQITALKGILNQLQNGVSSRQFAYAQTMSFLEANRHLLDSTHHTVQEVYLRIALNVAEQKSLYMNEILMEIIKPYVFQSITKDPRPKRFNQAILEVAAEALSHYRKQVEFTEEISKKNMIMPLVFHILHDEYKYYKAAANILCMVLSNIDNHTNEITPLLEDIIIKLKKKEITFPLEALSNSRNPNIWRLVLECDQKIKFHSRWMSEGLVQVYRDDQELFLQICHWECTAKYLPEIWSKIAPQQFISSIGPKYEDWLKFQYISSLIDQKLLDPLVRASQDDLAALSAICFIIVNANAEQDTVLEKTDIINAIGSKTKSKNSEEAQLARATMQKLVKKIRFAPLIAQMMKNKTIVLY